MFTINARLDIPEVNELLAMYGLEDHGRVQKAVDKAVIDYCMPYWAWDTGTLARSAYAGSDIGSGQVIYPGPYAHYQYYGVVYTDELGRTFVGPGETKPINTGRPLNYKTDVNPLAGAYPFERMKADHAQDIVEEARSVALG